jgi:hypothetical protein
MGDFVGFFAGKLEQEPRALSSKNDYKKIVEA